VSTDFINNVKTPCIGVCSTGIGDSVCRGCKRFVHEVIHWNSYSQQQKRIIDQRLSQFLSQIVASKLTVLDKALLRWHLEAQQIPFSSHKGEYIWAYELLRAGASQIADVDVYGLRIDAEYKHLPLLQLRRIIDDEFHILSQAHYDRYFQLVPSAAVD
jgi:hypothetical protein